MAVYVIDTSALARRYVSEPGTAWMQSITDPAAANDIYIAAITGAELVAAVQRKTRLTPPQLSAADAAVLLDEFRGDYMAQYLIIDVERPIVEVAMDLAERHPLRGYDSVQLAVALRVHARMSALATGVPGVTLPVLITSDKAMQSAARAEGIAVDDPGAHP